MNFLRKKETVESVLKEIILLFLSVEKKGESYCYRRFKIDTIGDAMISIEFKNNIIKMNYLESYYIKKGLDKKQFDLLKEYRNELKKIRTK